MFVVSAPCRKWVVLAKPHPPLPRDWSVAAGSVASLSGAEKGLACGSVQCSDGQGRQVTCCPLLPQRPLPQGDTSQQRLEAPAEAAVAGRGPP